MSDTKLHQTNFKLTSTELEMLKAIALIRGCNRTEVIKQAITDIYTQVIEEQKQNPLARLQEIQQRVASA